MLYVVDVMCVNLRQPTASAPAAQPSFASRDFYLCRAAHLHFPNVQKSWQRERHTSECFMVILVPKPTVVYGDVDGESSERKRNPHICMKPVALCGHKDLFLSRFIYKSCEFRDQPEDPDLLPHT